MFCKFLPDVKVMSVFTFLIFFLIFVPVLGTHGIFFEFLWVELAQTVELKSRKFYIRRNNSKVDSIETGRIVTAHLFP